MTIAAPAPIDPFAITGQARYEDEVVVVTRRGAAHPVHTSHFDVWTEAGRLHVAHNLADEHIDNDLAGLIAGELFGPGWLGGGHEVFERVFTGVVLTMRTDADAAWELFYRNTMARLSAPAPTQKPGTLSEYAPVYEHAASLVEPGTALELGCCFGFLSMQLAGRGIAVTASDVTANTVRLLGQVAPRLGRDLDTLVCDAARVPRPDRSFDTVLAVHLLEHLEPDHGAVVLAEASRLARRRVVVAVPYEDEPTAAFGHVRTFDEATLRRLGDSTGWRFEVHSHHGGWLVLDRP